MPDSGGGVLYTRRLILRRFAPEDAAAMLLIFGDREVNTFLPWFPVNTLEEALAFYEERYAAAERQGEMYRFAICLRTDNRPIGYIHINRGEGHDLGYGLRKEWWGGGIVTEAGTAVLERAQKDGLPYVTATHDINNPRSGAVMRRLGLTYRYSYDELWQPKNKWVTFRMYQRNFSMPSDWTYMRYWDRYPGHRVEPPERDGF